MNRYKKITLLHSNDMHGDFLAEQIDDKLVGGISMLSGYINKVRQEEPNTIYCIAGDMFRGSVIDSEFQGLSTIEIMNMLAPDVVTIGNHETDYGLAHLLFIEKCANFPIINANLHVTMNNSRLFRPYEILNIDGMKILFIGVITQEVIASTKQNDIIGTFVDIDDAAEEIGKICNAFNTIDIDFTVLLTHIGFDEDIKLAEKLDPAWGVDVIIGGHSHTFLDKPAMVNGIPIVQAGTGTDQIGRFDIIVDTDNNCIDTFTWSTIPINDKNCPKDDKIETLINAMKEKTDLKYDRVICRISRKLNHENRYKQTQLGAFVADCLKQALGLNMYLVASGEIRTKSLDQIVTYRDLAEMFPFSQCCYSMNIKGEQLKRMFKYVFRDETWDHSYHGEFYQVSTGLTITYNRTTHEFVTFSYKGYPVNDDDIFTVGMTDYHFKNFEYIFGFSRDEIDANRKPRKVATNNLETLLEFLPEYHDIDPDGEYRIQIID